VCKLIKLKSISNHFHPNLKLQLSPTILLCSVWANEILRIPFKRLPVGYALVCALRTATLNPQMTRVAAAAPPRLHACSNRVLSSGFRKRRDVPGPFVELGRTAGVRSSSAHHRLVARVGPVVISRLGREVPEEQTNGPGFGLFSRPKS